MIGGFSYHNHPRFAEGALPTEADQQFAEFLAAEGVIASADLEGALAAVDRIAALGICVTLADVLTSRGVLTPEKTAGLLGVSIRRSEGGVLGSRFDGLHLPAEQERRLAEIAAAQGWVTVEGCREAVRLQAALEIEGLKVPLAAILVDRAGLPAEAVEDLARKAAVPFTAAPGDVPASVAGPGAAPASGGGPAPPAGRGRPGGPGAEARPASAAAGRASGVHRASASPQPSPPPARPPAGARPESRGSLPPVRPRRGASSGAHRPVPAGRGEAPPGPAGLSAPLLAGGAGLILLVGGLGAYLGWRSGEPQESPRPATRVDGPRAPANAAPPLDPARPPVAEEPKRESEESSARAAIDRARARADQGELEPALDSLAAALAGPLGRHEAARALLEAERENLLERAGDALLRRAQELVAKGERDAAGDLLRRILARFPGTLHEDAARHMLDALAGGGPRPGPAGEPGSGGVREPAGGPGPAPGPDPVREPRPVRGPVSAEDRRRAYELADKAAELADKREDDAARRRIQEALAIDPECALAIGIRGFLVKAHNRQEALEDLTFAIDHMERDRINWPWILSRRIFLYMEAGNWRAVFEEADRAIATLGSRSGYYPQFVSFRGWARVNLGDIDGGLSEMDRAVQMEPDRAYMYVRFHAYLYKADWAALLAEADRSLRIEPRNSNAPYHRIRALVALGRFDEAATEVERVRAVHGSSGLTSMCAAYFHSTPGAGRHYDPDRALREMGRVSLTSTFEALHTQGRILFLSERYTQVVSELESHGHLDEFEIVFLLGAAHFKLGNFAEARRRLGEARRLNPYLRRHAEPIAGLAEYLDSFDRSERATARAVREFKITFEAETAPLSRAEIDTMVRRFEFERAVREGERHRDAMESPDLREETERRLAEIRGLATCFRRFREMLDAGRIPDLKVRAGTMEVAVTRSAAGGSFEYSFPKGAGKAPWGALGIETMLAALHRAAPTPEESVALGLLAWDLGLPDRSFELLRKGEKGGPKARALLDLGVSARRGLSVPEGGFLACRGRFVTPEEKQHLDAGRVEFEGQWVTPAAREKLARGLIEVSGTWVPREEGELLRRGFKRYKDRWYSREEYLSIRSRWEDAYEVRTEHYEIRTNRSEEFAAELGKVAEAAYRELRALYGGDEPRLPGRERMTLWAFARFEDYRAYCVEHKCEDHLQAAGFARSDSNVVVGWDKTESLQQFLQTMAHEAAHLYYFRVRPAGRPPSWYTEGMATQLEGFTWKGSEYAFDRVSASRLPFLKESIRKSRLLPLDQLLAGNALSLINSDPEKALVFYAQSWGLFYFLTNTNRADLRDAFEKYRKSIDAGTDRPLSDFLPDLKKLEADLTKYIEAM